MLQAHHDGHDTLADTDDNKSTKHSGIGHMMQSINGAVCNAMQAVFSYQ